MSQTQQCANCDRPIDGASQAFCPRCGQATPAHRIDWHFMAHEFEHSVLHMDRGILYSLRELMRRPGPLIRAYLEGRRARQAKPLLLLMVMAAAMVFLGKYALGGEIMGMGLDAPPVPAGGGAEAALHARIAATFAQVQGWMNHHFTATTLLLLPLEAAMFRLAFGRSAGLNYSEWLVVAAFLTVQTFVLCILAVPLQRWFPHLHAQVWATWLAIGYGVVSLVWLLADRPRWKMALRAILAFALYLLANGLLVTALVAGLVLAGPRPA